MPLFLPVEKAKETLFKLAYCQLETEALQEKAKQNKKPWNNTDLRKKEIELKEKSSINWI